MNKDMTNPGATYKWMQEKDGVCVEEVTEQDVSVLGKVERKAQNELVQKSDRRCLHLQVSKQHGFITHP